VSTDSLGLTAQQLKEFSQKAIESLMDGFVAALRDELGEDAPGTAIALADSASVPVEHLAKVVVQLATVVARGMVEENNKAITRQLESRGLVNWSQRLQSGS